MIIFNGSVQKVKACMSYLSLQINDTQASLPYTYVPFGAPPLRMAVAAHLTSLPSFCEATVLILFQRDITRCLSFNSWICGGYVSSGSVSRRCRGIKGNVAPCQRLDLFSPPSRNAEGQRETRSSRSDV